MQRLSKDLILNHLIWQSNRQDIFKRVVSQKLGTVYTLKDLYSNNLQKCQTIKSLFNAKKPTMDRAALIIDGKPEAALL